ncbi:MerR family transcriptional regulator [Neobacillus niacini]|uniref:MerR family transcriptional regulator n=1 Tax=Neobacillus niacini TaxID=86668 RepID=UPI003002F140
MADQEGKYNIKAAALMLGIQAGTLRAWERRYQMIAPVRNDAGHRLYTDEHIRILKWLIKKVNQGFTISQAVSLMGHAHSQMDSETINLKQGNPLTSLSDALYDALVHFEYDKIHEVINKLFSIFTMEKVIGDIFSQVVLNIETSFKTGNITNGQRNFSVSFLKARITAIIHSLPNNAHQNKAVFLSCSQEEDHFSILMFTFYLRTKGIEVINIGSYSSEEDIQLTLEIIHPDLFILTCEEQKDVKQALSLVNQLSRNHKDLKIGLGGEAITEMNRSDKGHISTYIFGQTIKEWEMWLMERMIY